MLSHGDSPRKMSTNFASLPQTFSFPAIVRVRARANYSRSVRCGQACHRSVGQAKAPVLSLVFRPVELVQTRSLDCARHENTRTESEPKNCRNEFPARRPLLATSCLRSSDRHDRRARGSRRTLRLCRLHHECREQDIRSRFRLEHSFRQHEFRRFWQRRGGQQRHANGHVDRHGDGGSHDLRT